MLRELLIRVSPAQAGERLDRVVMAALPEISRSSVTAAFAEGQVTIAGRLVSKGCRAVADEVVRVARLLERGDLRALPVAGSLAVIHEDEALLAFHKPGGQDCAPVRVGETGTLVNAMLARYPALAEIGGDPRMPALLHRIDAGTSGLVLAARTEAAFEAVRRQFSGQSIAKTYLALVVGRVAAPGGVAGHLAHTPGDRGRMRVVVPGVVPGGERALRAETFYRPLRDVAGHTLLEVTIRTGVTHQIRCQLASIGHPIVGDGRYGAASGFPGNPRRLFLHSAGIVLVHPSTGAELSLQAPLPEDLEACLARLTAGVAGRGRTSGVRAN